MNLIRSQIMVSVALLAAQATLAAQNEAPERLILSRTVAAIEKMHSEWHYVPVICSVCSPIMGEEVGQVNGIWRRAAPDQSMIDLAIHRITTADVAGRFLDRQLSTVLPGWTVQPYKFADGATMATYPVPRGFTQYNMTFRKGRFLIRLSGRSQDTIAMFAQSVLTAMAN